MCNYLLLRKNFDLILIHKGDAEKSAERKETGDYTLSVTGTDVKSMTQSLVAGSVSISVPDRSSFDIKA